MKIIVDKSPEGVPFCTCDLYLDVLGATGSIKIHREYRDIFEADNFGNMILREFNRFHTAIKNHKKSNRWHR